MPTSQHKQSRRMSLVEALVNIAVGYFVAVAMKILPFPLFGLDASLEENLAFGGEEVADHGSPQAGGPRPAHSCHAGFAVALGQPRVILFGE